MAKPSQVQARPIKSKAKRIPDRVRAQARLLEDERARGQAKGGRASAARSGATPASRSRSTLPPRCTTTSGSRWTACSPPGRSRRAPRLDPARQAAGDADRGPPDGVPRVRGRDPEGRVRRRPGDRLGPRRLREHLRDPAAARSSLSRRPWRRATSRSSCSARRSAAPTPWSAHRTPATASSGC